MNPYESRIIASSREVFNRLNILFENNNELIYNNESAVTYLKKDLINHKLSVLYGRYFVYFLMSGGEIVYVGKSKDLYTRLDQHLYDKCFEYVLVAEFRSEYAMNESERKMISFFRPKYNIVNKNTYIYYHSLI